MKKFISMLVIIAMSLSLSTDVMAAEKPTIIDKKIYKELKDPNELLDSSIMQYKDKLKNGGTLEDDLTTNQSLVEDTDSEHASNDEITVTQLLEEDTYSDGTVERKYSTTNLLVLDENNNIVGISQLASSYYTINGQSSTSGGKYNLVDCCTAYWTYRDASDYDTVRCDYTTNEIVGSTNGQYSVTNLDCAFKCSNDIWNSPTYIDHDYFYNPTPYTIYTAYNPRPLFYSVSYMAINIAGAVITYNDGSTYEIKIDIIAASTIS